MTIGIVAIDQGTTNTKVLLVGPDGSIFARATRPLKVSYPEPGWAEQSAVELWESVALGIASVIEQAPGCEIAAVGISNQRETIVMWDRATGAPVGPAIIWQCRRTSARCADLRTAGHDTVIVDRTGLGIDPLFPSGKIGWLLDRIEDGRARAARGELACGTVDSWLLWNLTGGAVHATDHSNASRTQLFNLDACDWDDEMLALFGVPRAILPVALASDSLFGTVAAGVSALPAGVPVHAMLGDSHAALMGHGIQGPGEAKVTCGTGSSLMALTPMRLRSSHGLSSTIAWTRGGVVQYALEGNITVSGHAAAFATRLLNLENEDALTALALSVPGCDGVTFVPALAGLGAPHWRDRARGLVDGMSLGTEPAHVARAVFEGIALQIFDVFSAMEANLGAALPSLSVDGGASKNDFLMQLLADFVDRPVLRPPMTDASALGAARIGAEALGIWSVARGNASPDRFEPKMSSAMREAIVARWHASIRRAGMIH